MMAYNLLSDKTLLFRSRSIDKLTLCVKGKRVTKCWGFELFHAGNVVLDTGSKEAYKAFYAVGAPRVAESRNSSSSTESSRPVSSDSAG